MLFQKITDGPSSYSTGGFDIRAGEYEKISRAEIMVEPETLLGTGKICGLELSYSKNVATVKVQEISSDSVATTWSEVSADTDLSGAKFILTGAAV